MNILTVNDVTKIINKRKVLSNISLSVPEGSVFALVGTNGSGKSMLLRLLCGLIHPTSGKVLYRDQVIHQDIFLPPSVGVIIENPGFWQDLSGTDNLKLYAQIKGIASLKDIQREMTLLGLDLDDRRPVRKYSLGMRQKLGIAQALMENPEILLLDEPMNALDKGTIEIVKSRLLREKANGITIILTSHRDVDFIDIADYIVEMEDGKICNEKQ